MDGMSKEEFEAELQRRFGWKQKPKAVIQDPLEALDGPTVKELLPDLLRAVASRRNTRNEHPLIVPILRENLSLDGLRIRANMTLADFGSAMADSLSILVYQKFSTASTQLDKVVANVDLSNFKDHSLASLSVPEPPELIEESQAFDSMKFTISEAPAAGRLRSFGGRVSFSRSVWSSHGERLANEIPQFAASVFAGIELRLLAELLEAQAGNIDSSTNGSSYGGLPEAAKTLRNQLNPAGAKANHALAAVIIPPELEIPFREYRQSLNWPDLSIVVNSHLTSATTWYGVASPSAAPAILRLRLRGENSPRVVSVSDEYEVMRFWMGYDVNFALSSESPSGLVRCVAG